ncbi:hypothetical protein PQR39_35480 [Paraburkholderia sediminicola]|uniref:hypothetical protein n=1 Tax=Paraburkholderia sediminicola TaxID=458836 RepID=UPI0038BA5F5F
MGLFDRPVIPPEVTAREEKWAAHREECLKRFWQAVEAGKRRDYRHCEAIIATVRAGHGQKAADVAAAELKKAIQREPKTKK